MANNYDAVLVGAGIMSATVASMLRQLEPDWRIIIVERLEHAGLESSSAWHNAGTGHAALCELNYTPLLPDGTVSIAKAVEVHSQWEKSLAYWAKLAADKRIDASFITSTPHMSFVQGDENVAFLRARYDALANVDKFANIEYTEDPNVIREWAPTLMAGRSVSDSLAATRAREGTDVDFGRLTEELIKDAQREQDNAGSLEVVYNTSVNALDRVDTGWHVVLHNRVLTTPFVFVGAGGGTLPLLQAAKLKEVRGYGGFPITGKFWATSTQTITANHHVKVYGQAEEGTPPMSVPHLDARAIDGEASVLFGPYAGFSTRFLKHGSLLALFRAVRFHNILPMLYVALTNVSLLRYLIGELTSSKNDKLRAVQAFYPEAALDQWREVLAGQRVQLIKPKGWGRGVLQFGTEVVADSSGSMAGVLGASPGASTAVSIAGDALEQCFSSKMDMWRRELNNMTTMNKDEARRALGLDENGN